MSIWSIIVVILMLGLLVTIHELGHLWAAQLLKIKAYEVSIFVGPTLFSWVRKGVSYSIRAIPFGAYVRFTDIDENGDPIDSDDPALLVNQPRWKRLIVALAGPFMNAVLGVVIIQIMFCIFGFYTTRINNTLEDTQLYGQEYTIGDEIVSVNGHTVFTYLDLQYELTDGASQADDMVLTLRSQDTDELYDVTLVPEMTTRPMIGITHYDTTDNKYNGWEVIDVMEDQNNGDPVLEVGDYLVSVDGVLVTDPNFYDLISEMTEGDTMLLGYVRNGVSYEEECIRTVITYPNDRGVYLIGKPVRSVNSFFEALLYSMKMPLTVADISVRAIQSVFVGQEEVYNMVSGPVGVTTAVSDVVDNVDSSIASKISSVMYMSGVISIGLVFTNLLPIPGLDGVQILLLVVEMIIGRKLSKKAEGVVNVIGFVALIGLVIFALASDVIRIFVE